MRSLNKKYWPYRLDILPDVDNDERRFEWCNENCNGKWIRVHNVIHDTYYFTDEKDITMFTLRWL